MAEKSRKEELIPVGDRVCISPIDESSQYGSIVVPDSAKPKPTRGKVTAVGPDVTQITKGMVVVFPKYSGVDVEVNHQEVVMMHEGDIIAIVAGA